MQGNIVKSKGSKNFKVEFKALLPFNISVCAKVGHLHKSVMMSA